MSKVKIRTVILDDAQFTCEFHAESCTHRKERVVKQYADEVDAESMDDLCAQLQADYRRDAETGWGDWLASEIVVSTREGSLFRVFPCVRI